MIIELQGGCRGKVVQHQAVVTLRGLDRGHTGQRQAYLVIALASIDGINTAVEANDVSTTATKDGVFASTHVNDVGTLTPDKFVVAIAPLKLQPIARTTNKFVFANTTTDRTGSSATQNHEAVVAQTAIKIEQRTNAAANIDGVVTLAAVADNFLDTARRIGVGLAE